MTSVHRSLGVVALAAIGLVPIVASAFGGAVLLPLIRVIRAEEACGGLRPETLVLIAGMVVPGIALEQRGLGGRATTALIGTGGRRGPLVALKLLSSATMVVIEVLSNATVAVLITPVAVALGGKSRCQSAPVSVAIMIAGSAVFATPAGCQTSVLVYQIRISIWTSSRAG